MQVTLGALLPHVHLSEHREVAVRQAGIRVVALKEHREGEREGERKGEVDGFGTKQGKGQAGWKDTVRSSTTVTARAVGSL